MEVKSRVLVIGINCMPELTGIGKYTGEMVSWLANNDHETTVVTGFPYYPYWEVQSPYTGRFFKKEISHRGRLCTYRCPMYVPEKPSGLKRMIHEATFFLSAFCVVFALLFRKKYDNIFVIAPPFHLGYLALFYRFFKGGKIVYHIQDLQVDAAKELKMLKPAWIFNILFSMERFILNHVNYVSSISSGMIAKIKNKTKTNILFFPNWVDTDISHPVYNPFSLKPQWGFKEDDKVVLYSGSIGEKQGLDVIIQIADNLKSDKKIQFVICGSGPFKDNLMSMVENKALSNVHFFPLQSKEVFNDFLNMADVHLVLQKGDASDLVMPSKLTTILSVGGLALVTANLGTTLYDVITEHEMGVTVPPENPDALQKQIELCCSFDYSKCRINARNYAEKYLNKESILISMLNKMSL